MQMNQEIYAFDKFQLDAQKRLLLRDGKPVQMTSKAFDLLLALVENKGREMSKDELLASVWRGSIVEEANLTVTMSSLRKALGEKADEHRFIVTIPGRGYRFVGELQPHEEFVIEQHTVSEIVIEKETIEGDKPSLPPATETKTLPQTTANVNQEAVSASPAVNIFTKRSRLKYVIAASALLAALALAFGAYKFLDGKKPDAPFQKIKLTRLTNSGRVAGAAVSPDSIYIAYVLGESEGNSLWVQQVGTASNIRVLPPTKAEFWGLTFSPDGAYIYYNLFFADKTDPELFRVPSLGGVPWRVPNVIAGFITFAPDGKRFAYTQPDSVAGFNYLVVADADGGNSRIIAKKKHPNSFEHRGHVASWSPDGEMIACLVHYFEADASYSSIVGISVKDGSERLLSERRWHGVLGLEWLKDGSGLLISASDEASTRNQVWLLPYPEGEARQITNDLGQYDSLSVTANGKSFVAVQTNTINSIFVGEAGQEANDFKEIASEVGPLSPLVWTPDGRIIFRSTADGNSNLWIMEADGTGRRQLTANAQVSDLGLCASPDGKQLVFASWRSGKSNLWRIAADGGDLTQLTNGEADAHPRCTPDGRWVVYQRGLHSYPTLWKVPLAGGAPIRLTDFRAKYHAISNDGSRISYFFMAEDKWRIGMISSDGGPMLRRLDVPATLRELVVRWSPDDQGLFYVSTVGNIGNVWFLPLDGAEPKPVTNFKSHLLEDFAWSPDGKLLAAVRNTRLSDVVLIESNE